MSYVTNIIDAFGGLRPMARALNKPVSTVQSWKVRGSIPDQIKLEIMDEARKRDIPLTPAHFFPTANPAPQTQGDAA